jgi:hypothetical protein
MYVINNKELGGDPTCDGAIVGYPPPCFGKRGCKLLISKGDERKKRGKRLQLAEGKELSWVGAMAARVIRQGNIMDVII